MDIPNSDEIKITARVNKPPYFRDSKFTIPVEIQYSDDIEISKNMRAYLNRKGSRPKSREVERNLRHIENVTFDCVLPIFLYSRIAFYPGLRGVECPYTTRPVIKIEILDGRDVLASYRVEEPI